MQGKVQSSLFFSANTRDFTSQPERLNLSPRGVEQACSTARSLSLRGDQPAWCVMGDASITHRSVRAPEVVPRFCLRRTQGSWSISRLSRPPQPEVETEGTALGRPIPVHQTRQTLGFGPGHKQRGTSIVGVLAGLRGKTCPLSWKQPLRSRLMA